MEAKFCILIFLATYKGSEAKQAPVTLSSTLGQLVSNQLFSWDFPLLRQRLPNPAYHGFESKIGKRETFNPQDDCKFEQKNLIVGSFGVITSPNYPKNYPPGLRCEWSLESEPGTVIRITFFDVVTQPWFLFFFDYLAVSLNGNWEKFYRMTGDMNRLAPISLESEDNQLSIRFASGFDFLNYRGFKASYFVSRRLLADDSSANVNATSSLDYGNGTDVAAICDYVPITLPPDSNGETPERVIGGSEVSPNEFPFVVAIIKDGTDFCSGSLIHESHVLTAAHCVPEGTERLELYFGVHDMRVDEDTRQYQVIRPQRLFRHPDYNQKTAANDIAVIKLNRPVKTTAYVQPVYIPTVFSIGNSFRGWNLTTMGWGDTSNAAVLGKKGKINPVLRKAVLPVIPNQDCRKFYRNVITGNMMCTAGSSRDSPCYGDSGAPLVAKFTRTQNTAEEIPSVVNEDNQVNQCYFSKSHRDREAQEKIHLGQTRTSDWFVQLGVLSFGSRACATGNPVTYTRVTAYLNFISGVISEGYA